MISKKNYKHDLRTVTMYLGVSNFQRAISIVIPRSRSAFSLSSTQAVPRHRSEKFTPLEIEKIHPHTILEGALTELSGLLLELLDGTLVDTTALVDQVCPIVSCCTPRSFGKVCLRPVVVDLPESTWPITTTLMCIFSLLRCMLANVCAMQTSDRQGLPQSEGGMLLTP